MRIVGGKYRHRIIEMTKGIHLKRGSMRMKISKEKQNKIDEILNLKGEK